MLLLNLIQVAESISESVVQCLFFDLPLQGRKVDGISNYLIFDQPDGKHKSRYFTALYQKVTMSTGLIPRRAELNIYYGYLWRRGLL